ncbi:MAG: metallophosphoesterase [Methanophagales archaeon ANME-1-THS]|nr:MAG: metallophosphoesterase [Methanophagales archaeon ANME-1-THS]
MHHANQLYKNLKMIILVLSDTHASDLSDLPPRIVAEIKGAELILHAGDYTTKKLLAQLREQADFKGVHGNMDPPELKSELPAHTIVEVQGFKIGITHPAEGGSPFGLKRRAKSKLAEELDVILYGHSHTPVSEREGNTLYLNPGSATGTFPARYKTYGLLRITDTVEGEIVRI